MSLDPTPLPEPEAFPANVQGPLAGSSVNAADVRTPVQVLGGRTKYLAVNQNFVRQTPDEAVYLALLNEILTDYAAHRANGGGAWHTNPDAVNTVSTTPIVAGPTSFPDARARTVLLITALVDHFDNTGGAFHGVTDSVGSAALNALATVEDLPTMITALRTIKAQLNLHRTRVGVHAVNDGVNVVTSADPIVGTVTGPLVVDTIWPRYRTIDAADGDQTLDPAVANVYFLAAPAAGRTHTITGTGTADGDWIRVIVPSTGGALAQTLIRDPALAGLALVDPQTWASILVMRCGGTWRVANATYDGVTVY